MNAGKTGDPDAVEREARRLYDACHPNDGFDDLKHRAAFSREDRMLLRDWLAAAAGRLAAGSAR